MIRLRSFTTVVCTMAVGAFVISLSCLPSLQAQVSSSASQIAQRQSLMQEYKRLNSAVEELMSAQTAQARRLSKLADNVRQLEQKVAGNEKQYATMEDVRRLEEAIKELDKKIDENNQLILRELKKLRQERRQGAARGGSGSDTASGGSGGGSSSPDGVPPKYDEGYWYTIKEGQTMSAVARAYQKQGVDVTVPILLEANPDVEPTKIQPGDKIWVPDP